MLSAVFSFRGRLNRLQYFLGSWGLGVAFIVVVAIFLVTFVGVGQPTGATLLRAGLLGFAALAVAFPLYLWVSFSLQARRFRDIGWEPVFVIPAWIGAGILDRLAVMGAPQIAVIHGSGVSWFGLLLNLGLGGCLLFWPGKPPLDVAAVFDEVPPPAQARQVAPSIARVQPVSAPAAPAGFGRRGL
jgi:uncharacterized membrane protein YhaH (DUF805 family)